MARACGTAAIGVRCIDVRGCVIADRAAHVVLADGVDAVFAVGVGVVSAAWTGGRLRRAVERVVDAVVLAFDAGCVSRARHTHARHRRVFLGPIDVFRHRTLLFIWFAAIFMRIRWI